MNLDDECPIGAVDEALRLASRIEIGKIPLDFDPGDLYWSETLATIAQRFSNHAALLHQLEDLLAKAQEELCVDCERMTADEGDRCANCGQRWLAEHRLWEAALEASEKAYQRWLARQALRRAAQRNA